MSEPTWWASQGEEPDARVSLANERTLLAYSRTAVGLIVAGIAIAGSHTAADIPVWFAAVGIPLIALGAVVSVAGRRRFVHVNRAVRTGDPLPAPTVATLLPYGIAATAACALIAAAVELATAG